MNVKSVQYQNLKLKCLSNIEWNKRKNGEKPLNSFETYIKLKIFFPENLIDLFEKTTCLVKDY